MQLVNNRTSEAIHIAKGGNDLSPIYVETLQNELSGLQNSMMVALLDEYGFAAYAAMMQTVRNLMQGDQTTVYVAPEIKNNTGYIDSIGNRIEQIRDFMVRARIPADGMRALEDVIAGYGALLPTEC